MRKISIFLVMVIICCVLGACTQASDTALGEQTSNGDANISEIELQTVTVYKVEPMQNVNYCTYYRQGQTPPVFNGDASRFYEKIYVATQCGICGEKNISTTLIDPNELDFSNSDTVIYSDSDQCYDCYWDKNIQQFMWSIRVSKTKVRVCTQCEKTEPTVTFSSNSPTCDGCNYNSQGGGLEEKLICSQCGADCTYRGLEEDGRCEDCYFGN